VWDRYLEFETLVGDLNSILKVDKRRRLAVEKDYSTRQTLLLVDRYKFCDLLPCAPADLRLLGLSAATASGAKPDHRQAAKSSDEQPAFPRPDLTQMLPFKPKLGPSQCRFSLFTHTHTRTRGFLG